MRLGGIERRQGFFKSLDLGNEGDGDPDANVHVALLVSTSSIVDVLLMVHILEVLSTVWWFRAIGVAVDVFLPIDPPNAISSRDDGVEGFPVAFSLLVSPIFMAVAFLFDCFLAYVILGIVVGDGFFAFLVSFLGGMACFFDIFLAFLWLKGVLLYWVRFLWLV